MANNALSCERKLYNLCVLSCTTMPLPDNEPFNIRFVQAVEKYTCLYDTTSPRYVSRDEQDKAWNCLAETFSSTGMYPDFDVYIISYNQGCVSLGILMIC